jgi:hypothetical protein
VAKSWNIYKFGGCAITWWTSFAYSEKLSTPITALFTELEKRRVIQNHKTSIQDTSVQCFYISLEAMQHCLYGLQQRRILGENSPKTILMLL